MTDLELCRRIQDEINDAVMGMDTQENDVLAVVEDAGLYCGVSVGDIRVLCSEEGFPWDDDGEDYDYGEVRRAVANQMRRRIQSLAAIIRALDPPLELLKNKEGNDLLTMWDLHDMQFRAGDRVVATDDDCGVVVVERAAAVDPLCAHGRQGGKMCPHCGPTAPNNEIKETQ